MHNNIGDTACAENGYVNRLDSANGEVLNRAIAILQTSRYCTLSTVSADGTPWGSPVAFTVDAALNVFWSSAIIAQHSRNIKQAAGQVVITLYTAHEGGATPTQGLYFRGRAAILEDEHQVDTVLGLIKTKLGQSVPRTAVDYLNESPRRMYRFEVDAAWITGDRLVDGNQLIDTKIELDVDQLKQTQGLHFL